MSWLERTKILIGNENINKLKDAKVVVLGLGGVGGSCAEALARAGVGNLIIIDSDTIEETNINRQVIATHSNIGKYKVDEMTTRLRAISPQINIDSKREFCLPQNSNFIFESSPDYIVDAIDTITMKIFLAIKTKEKNIKFVSSMGMGNRLDPSLIRYGSLKDTAGSGCTVAKVMRANLRKNNLSDILNIDVVYSLEKPRKVIIKSEIKNKNSNKNNLNFKNSPGSFSFVPPVAGYFLAHKVISNLIN